MAKTKPADLKPYTTLHGVRHNGKYYATGSIVLLGAEEAAPLLKIKAVASAAEGAGAGDPEDAQE